MGPPPGAGGATQGDTSDSTLLHRRQRAAFGSTTRGGGGPANTVSYYSGLAESVYGRKVVPRQARAVAGRCVTRIHYEKIIDKDGTGRRPRIGAFGETHRHEGCHFAGPSRAAPSCVRPIGNHGEESNGTNHRPIRNYWLTRLRRPRPLPPAAPPRPPLFVRVIW